MHSLGEAVEIFRERNPRKIAAAAFHSGVRRGVILKMGSSGSRLYLADGTGAVVGTAKVKPVDATGAGDAFNAGFIASRLRGAGPIEAVRAGSAAGALAVSGMGGAGNIRNWAQVRALAGRIGVATASFRRVEYGDSQPDKDGMD
jgi:sugar/nucleoside kinase (ribokinase family)